MIRIHLAGRLSIEVDGVRADQQDFPGNQGRLAFAYLACERGRPVARQELAHILWPDTLPGAWDSAVSAIVSKLRAVIGKTGLNGAKVLTNSAGCYELRFPGDVWLDLEVATDSIHDAEVALRLTTCGRRMDPQRSRTISHVVRSWPALIHLGWTPHVTSCEASSFVHSSAGAGVSVESRVYVGGGGGQGCRGARAVS